MNVSRETGDVDVSRETKERFEVFACLLRAWNARINLIGATQDDIWPRHIRDSLRLIGKIPANTDRAIDLGSGAGFPGLIVAIATGMHVHLLEADRRKAAFLLEAARLTSAPVTIHASRIEDRPCAPAALIMSRALAPLPKLLTLAHPLLLAGGCCLFHKGRNVETELFAARKHWTMAVETFADEADPNSVILRLTKVARV